MSEKFPCRTKTVEEYSYSITYFGIDDKPRMHVSSYPTRDAASKIGDTMIKKLESILRYEINEHHTIREICIECGNEAW